MKLQNLFTQSHKLNGRRGQGGGLITCTNLVNYHDQWLDLGVSWHIHYESHGMHECPKGLDFSCADAHSTLRHRTSQASSISQCNVKCSQDGRSAKFERAQFLSHFESAGHVWKRGVTSVSGVSVCYPH